MHCRLEHLNPFPASKAGLPWMEGGCSHERASLGVAGTSLLRAVTYPAWGCTRSLYLSVFTEAQTQQKCTGNRVELPGSPPRESAFFWSACWQVLTLTCAHHFWKADFNYGLEKQNYLDSARRSQSGAFSYFDPF